MSFKLNKGGSAFLSSGTPKTHRIFFSKLFQSRKILKLLKILCNEFSSFRLDGSTRILTLTQEKFNADGTSTPGALWNVPIKIMKNNKEVIEVLMEQKEMIVKLENVQESDWYKVNPDFYGYYR